MPVYIREWANMSTRYQPEKLRYPCFVPGNVSANKELYEEIRRDSGMCQALRELMKDEIDKEIEGAEAGIIKNMYNNGVTPEQISSMTDMELDKVKRIIYGNKSVVV